ncbi:MAG: transporter [Chthoniobacterales bacterium]|nr:transporter [Chthoniobacterales bacterium]
MRELSTDRPDVTESPRTVDAGHIQLEMSFVEYTLETDGVDSDEFTVLPFNAKIGLLNNLDLQLVVDPYVHRDIDNASDESGAGNAQLRGKLNLWGNDAGNTALGLMPFVQLPTGDEEIDESDDHVEGGVIIPFSIDLNERFTLSLMGEFDFLHDAEDDDYNTEFVHTASLGAGLTETFGVYLEYVGVVPFESASDYSASIGTGAALRLSDGVQLDAAIYFGLNEEAENLRALTGISVRL